MLFSKSTLLLATAALLGISQAIEYEAPFDRCRSVNGVQEGGSLILHVECYTSLDYNEDTTRAISSMDLNHCLLNRDGQLTAQQDGFAFNSCTNCAVSYDGKWIDCPNSCKSIAFAETPISITDDGLIFCYGETSTPTDTAQTEQGTTAF